MNVSGISNVHGPHAMNAPHQAYAAKPAPRPASAQPVDQLELSDNAQFLSDVRESGDVRHELVASIKQQIATGTYETDAKLDAAVSRLLDEIG